MNKRVIGTTVGIFAAVGFVTVTALSVYGLLKIKKITDRADEDPVDEESAPSTEKAISKE